MPRSQATTTYAIHHRELFRVKSGTELSPEDRCLLLLAQGARAPEIRDEVRELLPHDISWTRILERARAHDVLPLVTQNLKLLGWPGVTAEIRTALEAAAGLTAARNALFARALTGVLKGFGEAGVPVIPLKGVALAEGLYGDITARACSDIDILVPRSFIPEAFRLLLANGWERGDDDEVDLTDIGLLLRSGIEYAFLSNSSRAPLLLELHWDIAWRWRGDCRAMDDLWAEARKQKVLGVEAYALSPEWEILYLSVHAARHRWHALKWLVDIHKACLARRIDWDRVNDKARHLGWGRVLEVTLSICRALLGTPVPEHLSRRAPPRWLSVFPKSPARPGLWDEAVFATRVMGGASAKLGYLGRLLFLPTIRERELISFPAPMGVLYYPLRPLRLACRWITLSSRNHGG